MIVGSILGVLAGGAIGFVVSKNMSRFTGGVCPILCNPKISIPYFALLGFILAQELIK